MSKAGVDEVTKSRSHVCWGVVGTFGGLFIHLIIGSLYQWGIINIYITSYFKLQDEKVNLEDNAIAFPVMMLCIGIMMRLGLYLSQITHPLLIMTWNVIIQSVLIFSSSYLNSMGAFIVVYGVLFGLVSGLNFMIPIVECNKFLPGRKMYVNGIILIGTGLGSLVFGLFSYNFLNPDKIPPKDGYYYGTPELEQIAKKVPECLRYLGLLYIGLGVIGILMIAKVCIHNRNEEHRKKEEQEAEESKQKMQESSEMKIKISEEPISNQCLEIVLDVGSNLGKEERNEEKQEPETKKEDIVEQNENNKEVEGRGEAKSFKQILCSKVCWVQSFVIFFGSCGVFLVNGNYKTYVKEDISDDEFLTIVGVVASVGNGVSRIFWNILFNHTGYKTVMSLNLGIQIVVYAIVRFTVQTPGVYLFMVFLINCCLGGLLVMAPTVSQVIFGQKIGSDFYGFYWTVFALSNLLQYAFVSGLTDKITFDGNIYIVLAMTVLSLLVLLFYRFQGPWKNRLDNLGFCSKCCQATSVQNNAERQKGK